MSNRDFWLDIVRRSDRVGRDVLTKGFSVPIGFVIFTDDDDGLRHLVVKEMGDKQHRAEVFGLIAMIAKATQAHGICVVGEASIKLLEKQNGEDSDAFRARTMSSSEQGESSVISQALATVAVYRDQDGLRKLISCYTQINRNASGEVESFGAAVVAPAGQSVAFGSLLYLLPEEIPTANEAIEAGRWLIKRAASEMKRLGIFSVQGETKP